MEPSANSTIEWTMLCGWITTSTRSISTPNSQCASIISKPLLNSVAESIVIFGPMFQVGCLSACSGVIESKSFRGISRNGPPEAVRIIARTSKELFAFEALKNRVVLAIHRQHVHAILSRRGITISPAITRISLLATARSLPASIAASAGRNPPVPTIATSTISASVRRAISSSPSCPQKFAACTQARASGCRSWFHRQGKQIALAFHSRLPRVFQRYCWRPARQFPSGPEYRVPLSARSRRSIRSRPESQHAYALRRFPFSFLHGTRITSRR